MATCKELFLVAIRWYETTAANADSPDRMTQAITQMDYPVFARAQ